MDATGLQIFLLLVLSTPAPAALEPLHFIGLLKNWTEAQTYCRENHKDLVTIDSEDDWARVTEKIGNSSHTDAWIGLHGDKNWRWSLDSTLLFQQYSGSQFEFNADSTSADCAALLSGRLNVVSCGLERPSLCYNAASGSIIRVSTKMSRQSAQSYCRETYTDLASITSEQQFNTLLSVIGSSSQSGLYHWVGLSRLGSWNWSDQSTASCRLWATGEPDIFGGPICAGAAVGGWFDDSCGSERPFICSAAPRRRVLKVVLKADGSVNLSDPLVQDAVLKQMDTDLREQGITRVLRLKWRQSSGVVLRNTEP